jgi:hypothetical protein
MFELILIIFEKDLNSEANFTETLRRSFRGLAVTFFKSYSGKRTSETEDQTGKKQENCILSGFDM